MAKIFTLLFLLSYTQFLFAQKEKDTTVKVNEHFITLSEIVVNKKLDVASFIERVKNDTTFYKAFRNLRIIGYTALNDIRMLDKNGNMLASLRSKTKQIRTGNLFRTPWLSCEFSNGNLCFVSQNRKL